MIGGTLFVLPFFVSGYDDTTTHRALTQEIINFFNYSYPDYEIPRSDGEEIIQGSEDEDSDTRWLYHFFDPVNNRGLVLETEAPYKDPELAYIGAAADLQKEWESSKEWAENTLLQGNREDSLFAGMFTDLFSDDDDYSWERAIYDYSWIDKNRGLRGLGHILHLLEDKTVPDHTRNDAHPPMLDLGSPYEYWTKKFNRSTIYISTLGLRPIELSHITDYFESLARYSNANFFSKDTISTIEYSDPKIISEKYQRLSDGRYYLFGYGRDPNTKELFPLVQIKKGYSSEESVTYSLRDTDDLILNGYWTRLSKQAVLHGAGAMKLFFDEVAKEKKTRALYDKNRSWLGKKFDSIAGIIFGYKGAPTSPEDIPVPPAPPPQPQVTIIEPIIPKKPQTLGVATEDPAAPPALPQSPTTDTSPSLPIAGVGGAPPKPEAAAEPEVMAPEAGGTGTSTATSSEVVIAPPHIIEPSASTTAFSTTTITFVGTAEPERIIIETTTGATTTADGAGAWTLILTPLARGTTTLLFFAKDREGYTSAGTAREIFIGPEGPDVSLTIENCAHSLSPELCLTTEPVLTLIWSFEDGAASAALECGVMDSAGEKPCTAFAPDMGTTTYMYEKWEQSALYRFRARAQDGEGNETVIQKYVRVEPRTVVINEIAWSGTGDTASTSEDKWLELYNPTEYPITLDGITLISLTDGTPRIPLSGVIGPRSYYLIESGDDDVVSNVAADLVADFSDTLSSKSEILALLLGETVLDSTLDPAECSGWWCYGLRAGFYRASMERIDPFEPGSDKNNWFTWTNNFHKTFYSRWLNREGGELQATPRARNSANAIISAKDVMTQSKTLRIENSPYVISLFFLTIDEDATLTIPEGVVVKLSTETHINIKGKLIIEGSETNPAVITSIFDDEYGGDLNEDGTSTPPRPGDWGGFRISSEGSSVKHAVIRYGGYPGFGGGTYSTNILIENASATITDSTIERSATTGIKFRWSNGSLERNIIRDNRGAGAFLEDSTVFMGGNTFSGNGTGVSISASNDSYLATMTANIFRKNTGTAITASNAKIESSGNIAEENGKNGIELSGILTSAAALDASLPYIVPSYHIRESGSLTIPAGTIVKFELGAIFTVDGALTVAGSAESPVIFTSIRDDEFGGDTNGDATSTIASPGDWQKIHIRGPGSLMTQARVRFGGGSGPAAINAENAELPISQMTIEKNMYGGLYLTNASSSISNSLFSDHAIPEGSSTAGLGLASSTASISETTFRKNNTGIAADSLSRVTNGGGILFEENGADTIPPGILP